VTAVRAEPLGAATAAAGRAAPPAPALGAPPTPAARTLVAKLAASGPHSRGRHRAGALPQRGALPPAPRGATPLAVRCPPRGVRRSHRRLHPAARRHGRGGHLRPDRGLPARPSGGGGAGVGGPPCRVLGRGGPGRPGVAASHGRPVAGHAGRRRLRRDLARHSGASRRSPAARGAGAGRPLPPAAALVAELAAAPRTLSHGDCRLDNMFFGPGGRVTLCDWQLPIGPAAPATWPTSWARASRRRTAPRSNDR
jgi:hypothetical protein